MNEKETYITPEIEIVEFEEEDIITASGNVDGGEGGIGGLSELR